MWCSSGLLQPPIAVWRSMTPECCAGELLNESSGTDSWDNGRVQGPRDRSAWSLVIHALHKGGNVHCLVIKEQAMMKGQTKNLTGQVREALLALPDTLLMQTLGE